MLEPQTKTVRLQFIVFNKQKMFAVQWTYTKHLPQRKAIKTNVNKSCSRRKWILVLTVRLQINCNTADIMHNIQNRETKYGILWMSANPSSSIQKMQLVSWNVSKITCLPPASNLHRVSTTSLQKIISPKVTSLTHLSKVPNIWRWISKSLQSLVFLPPVNISFSSFESY